MLGSVKMGDSQQRRVHLVMEKISCLVKCHFKRNDQTLNNILMVLRMFFSHAQLPSIYMKLF